MNTTEQKAVRLVLEGRVRLVHQTEDVLWGHVQGDSGLYRVEVDPDGHHCDCEHGRWTNRRCSHSLGLVLLAKALAEGVEVKQLEEVYG